FAYRLLAGIDTKQHKDGIHMTPTFGHLKHMKGYCPVQGEDAGIGFDLRLNDQQLTGEIRADRVPVLFSWGGHDLEIAAGTTRKIDLKKRK
ncbi:MAG: hypothetical protein AB8H12_20640, partial [Lewinella sp.]